MSGLSRDGSYVGATDSNSLGLSRIPRAAHDRVRTTRIAMGARTRQL